MSENLRGYQVTDIMLIGEKQGKATINSYKKHLTAYAEDNHLDAENPRLWFTQQALLTAVHSMKIEDIYDPNIVFGAAAVIGNANYRWAHIEWSRNPENISPEIFENHTHDTINIIARWLSTQRLSRPGSWRRFFRPKPLPVYDQTVYKDHLENIVQKWPRR